MLHSPYPRLTVKGMLKKGNQLYFLKQRHFLNCGEGGGMTTKNLPCQSLIYRNDRAPLNVTDPLFGRCKKHPRKYGEETIQLFSRTEYNGGCSTEIFVIEDTRIVMQDIGMYAEFTHMNNEKLETIFEQFKHTN
jgi:hypothetical protein